MNQTTAPQDIPGAVHGNSGLLAHKAGLTDWKPGDMIPEHYIVDAVSADEVCPYCEKLKADLDSYVARGLLTYEVRRHTRPERLQLYARLGMKPEDGRVPQFTLLDRRSDREQHIGGREDAMVWLYEMYQRGEREGLV